MISSKEVSCRIAGDFSCESTTLYNSLYEHPGLHRHRNGTPPQRRERGARKLIAYHGIVYDVSDCPKWRSDLHEQLHFPGQDLTGELSDAPHQEEVFSRPCVKVVGKLESNQR
jgi:predicted heme/steroid binding protein